MHRLRLVARFFALGALLFFGKLGVARLTPPPRASIEVIVPARADADETSRRIDDAILLEEAIRFGWASTDPVVRRRLAVNMAIAHGGEGPTRDADVSEAEITEALELGMHRTDPVVVGRLVARARQLLDSTAGAAPDDEALRAHLAQHRARFARPARVTFLQVVVRRDLHGDATEAEAEARLERLQRGGSDEAARALGDPMPLLTTRQSAQLGAIDRLFGPGFGEAVAALPAGSWQGPVRSAYGLHLVRVEAVERERLPPLEAIRPRVVADYHATRRHARVRERMRALRARYDVRVVRAGETS